MRVFCKRFVICLLVMVSLVFSGCSNIFGKQNSITPVEDPKPWEQPPPSDGGGGGSGWQPGEESKPGSWEEPHVPLDDYLHGVRLTYKQDAALNAEDIEQDLYKASENILTRLVAEYGPVGADLTVSYDELLGVPLETVSLTPLQTAKRSDFESILNMNSNASDDQFLMYLKDMTAIKTVKTIPSGNNTIALMLSTEENDTVDFSFASNFTISGTGLLPLYNLANVENAASLPIGTPAASYNVVAAGVYMLGNNISSKRVYFIFDIGGTNNIENFDLAKLADSHYDSIRYNLVSFNKEQAPEYAAWNWTLGREVSDLLFNAEYINVYKTRLAANIAKLQIFGKNPIPEIIDDGVNIKTLFVNANGVGVGAADAASDFINFCSKYVDHKGFSKLEADMIATFIYDEVIGNSVTGLETFISRTGSETFNSNEAITNDADEIIGYRKLISDYNNIDVRWGEYNDVFNSISYNTDLNDLEYDSDLGFEEGKYNGLFDSRNIGFKNYLNTVYSAAHVMKTFYPIVGMLEYVDVAQDYIADVSYNPVKEGENDEWGEGQDPVEAVLDKELAGKIQSLILLPKEDFNITYLIIGFEIDNEINGLGTTLPAGEELKIKPLLRYSDGQGNIYQCFMSEAILQVIEEEDGTTSADWAESVWDTALVKPCDMEGKELENLMIMPLDTVNFGYDAGDMRGFINKKDKQPANPEDYIVNNSSKQTSASFIYNNLENSFLEISFIVTLDGKPYDYNFGFGIRLLGIFGDLL